MPISSNFSRSVIVSLTREIPSLAGNPPPTTRPIRRPLPSRWTINCRNWPIHIERAAASSGRRRLPPRATTWVMLIVHPAARPCFHPIPPEEIHRLKTRCVEGDLKCLATAGQKGKAMSDDAKLSARRLRLKLALEELREMKGFGTELVTLIIPPDRQISDARSMLQNEHGQAANIKSKGTRKNVQGAIESAISTLSRYKTPGENGLAIFVGSIIIGNNKSRMVNIVVEDPPQSLVSFRYRCDSRFELTQLEEMLVDKKSYALFVIDRAEAAYGIATGKRIHVQEHLVSNIMGKHRQGGQSAQRFERLIECNHCLYVALPFLDLNNQELTEKKYRYYHMVCYIFSLLVFYNKSTSNYIFSFIYHS